MRVLVDTSVWVDFFNQHPSPQAGALLQLIKDEANIVTCGLVIAEFFQGVRKQATLRELETYFREMELLTPAEPDTYLHSAALFRKLRGRGVTVRSTIDCLIVRLAEENDALLLARDRDVVQILESGLSEARSVRL